MTVHVEVRHPGPLTTVQDGGRKGLRHLGVSPSGAADRGAMRRANLLAGNPPETALLEVTLGGLVVAVDGPVRCALTGARPPQSVHEAAVDLAAGEVLALGHAGHGLRAYVAFAGGLDVPPVLGSRSTDTLAGLGPAPLAARQVLAVGPALGEPAPAVPAPPLPGSQTVLALVRGPRDAWLDDAGWAALVAARWTVSAQSNRTALRLDGPPLRVSPEPLEPEPLVRGAVQMPPDGRPIVFLADHPVTGGYPVVGVLADDACDTAAQCRPGSFVRLVS